MNKKYELTDETIIIADHTLYKIRAIRNFGSIKLGDFGGYIEDEKNLSHSNNCWVYGNSWLFDNACVFGNSIVYDNAKIFGEVMIYGSAQIGGSSQISGYVQISEYAKISENANLSGRVSVSGYSWIHGDTCIFGPETYDHSIAFSDTIWIEGNIRINGGIWNKTINADGKLYLVSSTMRRIMLGEIDDD